MFAADSICANDAVIFGGPLWQPSGGQMGGAIELDGVDDCVIVGSIADPTDGSFSIVAWIKGGTPGQVVLSQIGEEDWLLTDPADGKLMTEFRTIGRDVEGALLSETVITEGAWHRIGFVWDGSHRKLYCDGVIAAEDTPNGLVGSSNGLYFGCDKNMAPGTFFSGLIDDVRIYNRVISP